MTDAVQEEGNPAVHSVTFSETFQAQPKDDRESTKIPETEIIEQEEEKRGSII